MATSAEIKSNNNTKIRVKTTAKSITKVSVADQLDACIDYTVQETALKVDKVVGERLINAAEITKLANTSGTNTGDQDLSGKQDVLVSATNIKTINGTSILGSGDLVVSGGGVQSLKIIKTTITSAQVLDLFTTPITILDSTESGKVRFPINIYIYKPSSSVGYSIPGSFTIINDFNTVMASNLNTSPLTGTTEGFTQSSITIIQNLSGGNKNNLYKLKCNTGNPTLGDANIDVYISYVEITL